MATNPDGPASEIDALCNAWADCGWAPWSTERWFDCRADEVTQALARGDR